MSQTGIEVVSKDEEIVDEDFETVAKKIEEDCCYASLECRMGVT